MADRQADAPPRTVPDLFRRVVARAGDRVAIETDEARITFRELDRLSNRVAHGLLREGRERPVAIVAPLAPSTIVVILGALKAGRVFTPIDARDPPERVRTIVEDLGAQLVGSLDEVLADREDDPCLALSPDGPSSVYFTSGSTGRPRGLIRTHAHLCYPAIGQGILDSDRVGLILPPAFAGSIAGLFSPLVTGATSCQFDPVTRGLEALASWIVTARVTVFQAAPSALAAIAQPLDAAGRTATDVRLIVVGGEPCDGEQLVVARRVFPRATILNHYGSTEASFLAATRIAPGEPVPAGPVLFRTVYPDQRLTIVDDEGRPVPLGEPGEIHVSSRHVALGYWGAPQPGDRPFVDEGDGCRSIRLHDRARLHAGGTLELLGRTDLRVKIHGQNVDVQAVERALEASPLVEQAVVSAVPGAGGHVRLVAHVVTAGGARVPSRDFRVLLAKALPPFAIPSAFFRVDAIPRTARGKVNREALRDLAAAVPPAEVEYVAPGTERERTVAELAADALGLPRVGIQDDLLDLGIDSFTVVSLVEAIGDRLGVRLSAADLLVAPTVEALAAKIAASDAPRHRVVVPAYSGGVGTPMFCVPGGGGGGTFTMRRLGRRVGRPTFSFLAPGLEGRAMPDRTLAGTAARFVAGVRETQPHGPYVIGGFSFGGLVAFEMARQIAESGETVALLLLIDPVTRVRHHLAASLQRVRDERAGRVQRRGPLVARALRRMVRLVTDEYRAATVGLVRRAPADQWRALFRLHVRMTRRYSPAPYPGRTLLLRTAEWQRFDDRDLSRWLTGPVRIETIPGGHASMFAETNIGTMAAIIRDELTAVDQSVGAR